MHENPHRSDRIFNYLWFHPNRWCRDYGTVLDKYEPWVIILNQLSNRLSEHSRLISAVSREDSRKRLEHQLRIKPIAAILDIRHVHLELLWKWQPATPRNLPNACQPGLYHQPLHVVQIIAFDFLHYRRTRAHEAHAPAEHVPQLRHLVQTRPA